MNIKSILLIASIICFFSLIQNVLGFGMDEVFYEDIGENLHRNAYDFIFRDILKFQTDYIDLGSTLSGNEINDFSDSFGGSAFNGPSGNIDSWLYRMFFGNNLQILNGSLQHDFVFGLLIPTVFLLLFISFMTNSIFKTGPKLTKLVYISAFIATIVGGFYPLIAGIAFSFFGKLLGGFFIFLWIKNVYASLMAPYWSAMETRENVGLKKASKWNAWLDVLFGDTSIFGGPAKVAKDYAVANKEYQDSRKKGAEAEKSRHVIMVGEDEASD